MKSARAERADNTPRMVNLLGLDRAELEAFCRAAGREAVSRAPALALDVPARRRRLRRDDRSGEVASRELAASPPRSRAAGDQRQVAADGTRKWLLDVGGGKASRRSSSPSPDRGTLCISSQVGCAMDCTFCSTAQQGFNRNLTVAEIIGQLWLANRALRADGGRPSPRGRRADHERRVHGHGRAARELSQRRAGAEIMMDDLGFGLSRRRVTVSHLGRRADDRSAARGLPGRARGLAARAERRAARQLVPINRKHPIAELLAACWHYVEQRAARHHHLRVRACSTASTTRRSTRALELVRAGRRRAGAGKVNLIPFNPFPASGLRARRASAWPRFRAMLQGRRDRDDRAQDARRRHRRPPAASSPARCRTRLAERGTRAAPMRVTVASPARCRVEPAIAARAVRTSMRLALSHRAALLAVIAGALAACVSETPKPPSRRGRRRPRTTGTPTA